MFSVSLVKFLLLIVGLVRCSQEIKMPKCLKTPDTSKKVDNAIKECQENVKLKMIHEYLTDNDPHIHGLYSPNHDYQSDHQPLSIMYDHLPDHDLPIHHHHTKINNDHHFSFNEHHPSSDGHHSPVNEHHSVKNEHYPSRHNYESSIHDHEPFSIHTTHTPIDAHYVPQHHSPKQHHSHDTHHVEKPHKFVYSSNDGTQGNSHPPREHPDSHVVDDMGSLSDNPLEHNQHIDLTDFRKKRHTGDDDWGYTSNVTYHDKRIAGCIMQCIYEKNDAVDKLGWPTLDGLVNFYSEGVNDHGYFMATLRAVDYCLKVSSIKYHVNRRSTPENGQTCDVAFDVFDCISDEITEYCDENHRS